MCTPPSRAPSLPPRCCSISCRCVCCCGISLWGPTLPPTSWASQQKGRCSQPSATGASQQVNPKDGGFEAHHLPLRNSLLYHCSLYLCDLCNACDVKHVVIAPEATRHVRQLYGKEADVADVFIFIVYEWLSGTSSLSTMPVCISRVCYTCSCPSCASTYLVYLDCSIPFSRASSLLLPLNFLHSSFLTYPYPIPSSIDTFSVLNSLTYTGISTTPTNTSSTSDAWHVL